MDSCDVLIVGAGAAGCAAAMSLPDGVSATLLDRTDPRRGRCCGGLLAPDAQAALARLALRLPHDVLVDPQPRTVRARDVECRATQVYRRNYVNVDRAKFDAHLVELASRRIRVVPRTRLVGLEVRPDETVATLVEGDARRTVRSRVLIGADGAASTVRKLAFGGRPRPSLAIAIQVRLAGRMESEAHEVLFGRRLTDFYAWAVPKQDTTLVGSAFGDAHGARDRFDEILSVYRRLLRLDGRVLERSARLLSRPASRAELLSGAGPVLLVGEAAGLISPSSGEGLSFAFESGRCAGEAVGEPRPGAAYGAAFAHQARRVSRKLIKARVIFSPVLRKMALRVPWCP